MWCKWGAVSTFEGTKFPSMMQYVPPLHKMPGRDKNQKPPKYVSNGARVIKTYRLCRAMLEIG